MFKQPTNINKMELDPKQETPFNMAMLFYISLNKFIVLKNEAYIMGDLKAWYRILQSIYRTIIFKVKDDKKEGIEDKFQQVKNMFKTHNIPNSLKGQYEQIASNSIEGVLDIIDKELTNIMDKNNMIFPSIETRGGLEKLYKELNIDTKK